MAEGRGEIAGYEFGTRSVVRSPLGIEDLDLLKQTVLFGEEDQVEDVLDVWYGFVGDHPHLIRYFSDAEGEPDTEYLGRVRGRFGQWILDTCRRPYDQEWLDYQQEIAMRHTRDKKNQTDGAYETPDHIGLRYMVAFIYPITATIKPFLAKRGHSAEEVDKMHQAWFKSVVLQVTLWSYPYVKNGDF